MKVLISATLSLEAGGIWSSWPRGQRSSMLSQLLVDEGVMQLESASKSLHLGHLRGNIATHRRQVADFLIRLPPIDEIDKKMFSKMLLEMNEDLDGTIHYVPGR